MKVKCLSCGAIIESNETKNCLYCGSSIQEVTQIKKIGSKNSDLTLAQIQFRDNDKEACIHTLNKILSKDPQNQSALVYKYMCKPDLYESNNNFFKQLKKSGIIKISEDIYEDLYIVLRKEILPDERYYSSVFFDPEFQILYDKLLEFLNYQNTDFKNKILNLLVEVYSTEYLAAKGYRHDMLSETKRLIIELEKWDIDKAIIKRAIITIKDLYSATINYYWKEAEQAHNEYIADKSPINEDNLKDKIKLYREIQDSTNILSFINKYQIANPSFDLGYSDFKCEVLEFENKFNSIDITKEEDKKNCFVATATMGDKNHPVVIDLRAFRDNFLLKRVWGVNFTNWYYTHGPKAANVIEKSIILKKITYYIIIKPLQIITKNLK
jgi:hypothetical protein